MKQAAQPKYSILLPTRNGGKYLAYAIKSVLSQNYDNMELIVSNNHSKDGTAAFLETLSDPRLKIIKPPEAESMAGHYEFLLSQAKGEWLTILGDDDAIQSNFFAQLDAIIEKNPEMSIISSVRAYYFWEGCEADYGDYVVSYDSQLKLEKRSTKMDLILGLAGIRSCFDMPMTYTTCVVKNSLVKEIKKKSGGYFYHSIIPDMYSVVALLMEESFYLRCYTPLFWVGTSNKSLGLSDRIYKDAEIQADIPVEKPQAPKRILKLHADISQNLHSCGTEPMYLFEALKQCVANDSFWHSKVVSYFVYAAILVSINEKELKVHNKEKSREIFEVERKRLELNKFVLDEFILLVKIFAFTTKVINKIKRIFKIGVSEHSRLVSTNRSDFPDIIMASEAVEKL